VSELHAPAALPPGKEPPVPIGQEVGWTSEPVWMIWRSENSWPHRASNSDSLVVNPVASRYTDYANWILDLLTQLRTTSNLQFTAANTRSSPARSLFNNRFLVTDINCGDSSASRSVPSGPANIPQLNSLSFHQLAWGPRYIASGGPNRKHPFQESLYCSRRVFTDSLPRNRLYHRCSIVCVCVCVYAAGFI
jgi:hypothetical protein